MVISGAEASDAVLIALLLTTPLPLVGAFSQLSNLAHTSLLSSSFFHLLAELDLCCSAWAFLVVARGDYSLAEVRRFLTAVDPPVAEHGL